MQAKPKDPLQQFTQLIFQDVTPVRLRLYFIANCLAAIIFCILSLITIEQHHHTIKTVGQDAAPSVIAAHQIKIAIEKMDAALIAELLHGSQTPKDEFEHWHSILNKQLVAAAKNITYGEAEQIPIENILNALGQFEMLTQSVRDAPMTEHGTMTLSLNLYRQSLNCIQTQLLPNADALNKANADKLESIYSQEESRSALSCGLLLAVALVIIYLLLATQIYLAKRFRRRLNLPLVVTTIANAVFVQHLYASLQENALHLRLAKRDAYDSMVALLDARANAYDANASESRGLLDRQHAPTYEKSFFDKLATVANFRPGHNFSETIACAKNQLAQDAKFNLPGFSGFLADELNNVRFEGEGREALLATEAFGSYCTADTKMRQLEELGNHEKALNIGLGYDPGDCQYWFSKFDDALEGTLELNQVHFSQAINKAFGDLAGLALFSQALLLLTIVCAYFGLRDRMAEYM